MVGTTLLHENFAAVKFCGYFNFVVILISHFYTKNCISGILNLRLGQNYEFRRYFNFMVDTKM